LIAVTLAKGISNVPIGAAILVVIIMFVALSPETNKKNLSLPIAEKLKHLDTLGTTIFLGAVVSLLLVLQWGGQTIPWGSATSIGLFVCFIVCGFIFIALQWRQEEYATIPFRIVRVRSVYMGAVVLFTLGAASISVRAPSPPETDVRRRSLTNTREAGVLSSALFPSNTRHIRYGERS
jgi:ABC-type transport system involved in cytochrome c biogenesis permease subunit